MSGRRKAALPPSDLSFFCAQIAWILKAGVPLEEGIAALRENARSDAEKALLGGIGDGLSETGSLARALKRSGAFPDYLVNMAEIGEKAGKLDDVSDSLAAYYGREDALRRQIRGAVTYPLALVLMIGAVLAVLTAKVLPVFRQVLGTLGADVPPASAAALEFGLAAGRTALALVLALALAAAAGALAVKTGRGARFFQALADRFPPARRIARSVDAARFSSALSMLLSSGYGIARALELMPGILSSPRDGRRAREISRAVSEGRPLSAALRESGLFPGLYSSMIGVGERTGNLDAVMRRIAEHAGGEAQGMLSGAAAGIEPALVGFLSVVIGAILLSILLPLAGILSQLG